MSKAMQLVGIILLGIFTLVIIYLMSDVRSTNELDYYLLQEVTEASMYDAVDYSYYRETGLLKVDRDMFLENFNRRFAESVDGNRNYDIKIIDFNETPPKVSVEVTAPTLASVKGEIALVTNRVSGIIETIYDDYVYSRGGYGKLTDDEAPEIVVTAVENTTNQYKITMTDNYMLDKYAIVELGKNKNNFPNNDFSSIKNWKNINGYKNEYEVTETIVLTSKSTYWVVAVDRGGLWTAVPITDVLPHISSIKYKNNGNLQATFKDDKGLEKYELYEAKCPGKITIEAGSLKAGCDKKWTTKKLITQKIEKTTPDGKGWVKATETIGLDYKDINFYMLKVYDTIGQTSEMFILSSSTHTLAVDYDYNSKNQKIEINIRDSFADLSKYVITTEKDPDKVKKWTDLPSGKTEVTMTKNNFTLDKNQKKYIHVKDEAGHTVTKELAITQTKYTLYARDNAGTGWAYDYSVDPVAPTKYDYTFEAGCTDENNCDGTAVNGYYEKENKSWPIPKKCQEPSSAKISLYKEDGNPNFLNKSNKNAPSCNQAGTICRYQLIATVLNGNEVISTTVLRSWAVMVDRSSYWKEETNISDINLCNDDGKCGNKIKISINNGGLVTSGYYFIAKIGKIEVTCKN